MDWTDSQLYMHFVALVASKLGVGNLSITTESNMLISKVAGLPLALEAFAMMCVSAILFRCIASHPNMQFSIGR